MVYTFYKKEYLGGAHGLGGNLNILLLSIKMNDFGVDLKHMHSIITHSIKHILKHLINGNFPTSTGSNNTKLIHFCHGCPGIVQCLARYSEIFPENGIHFGIK